MPDARAPEIQGKRSLESKRCDDGGYEQIRIDEEWQKKEIPDALHVTDRRSGYAQECRGDVWLVQENNGWEANENVGSGSPASFLSSCGASGWPGKGKTLAFFAA